MSFEILSEPYLPLWLKKKKSRVSGQFLKLKSKLGNTCFFRKKIWAID